KVRQSSPAGRTGWPGPRRSRPNRRARNAHRKGALSLPLRNSRLHHFVGPGLSLSPRQPLIGLLIVNELFAGGIPFQFPSKPDGDVPQMTDAGGAMANLGITNRLFAGLHAIEEVPHV